MKFTTNLRVVEAVPTVPWVPSWGQGSREPLEPTKSVHYTDPLTHSLPIANILAKLSGHVLQIANLLAKLVRPVKSLCVS